jgi:hypothetical protein
MPFGYDFSSLRPKGAAVKGVGADASGPLGPETRGMVMTAELDVIEAEITLG